MRTQLRPFHDEVTLAKIYDHPYDHTRWEDHVDRVAWTVRAGVDLVERRQAVQLVDLSCGDGAVLRGIQAGVKHETELIFGDLVDADHVDLIGPIEATLESFSTRARAWNVLVLTETLEHLEDPDLVLRLARARFDSLLVTTPIDETLEAHDNVEHYWAWSEDDVRSMLTAAGWIPMMSDRMNTDWYDYQLWGCR